MLNVCKVVLWKRIVFVFCDFRKGKFRMGLNLIGWKLLRGRN